MKKFWCCLSLLCCILFQQSMSAMAHRLPQESVEVLARGLIDSAGQGHSQGCLLRFFQTRRHNLEQFRAKQLKMPEIVERLDRHTSSMILSGSLETQLFFQYTSLIEVLRAVAMCKQLDCDIDPRDLFEGGNFYNHMDQLLAKVSSSGISLERLLAEFPESDMRELFLAEGERLADAIICVLDSEQ